jgi:hypothetical protein
MCSTWVVCKSADWRSGAAAWMRSDGTVRLHFLLSVAHSSKSLTYVGTLYFYPMRERINMT